MVKTLHDIDIPSAFSDREVRAAFQTDQDYAAFYIKAVGFDETPRREQFAYIRKEELLDVLAQMGWLPDEYRKPEPLDPREAKIRAVTLVIYNDDTSREAIAFHKQYDTYEELAEYLGASVVLGDYRSNAEALIDAGLVKVDDE